MTVAGLERGRYAITGLVGRGGMALVYRADDLEDGGEVAVKMLADNLACDAEIRRRFLREAQLAERLSHPNIARVLDHGELDGRPSIVLELVDGPTLADELERRGPLTPERTRELGSAIASGLAHAHARGLVHRDVKPHNLLLDGDGRVKISDFGIARVLDDTQVTQAGTVLGTAAYLAPEQAAGEPVTAAADVYALGVVLYEALTGKTPHPARTLTELLVAQQSSAPQPPGELAVDVPVELESLILRCLAADPAARPTADEVERTLSGELEAPTRIMPPAPGRPRLRTRRRFRGPAIVAAVLLVCLAVGLGVGLGRGGGAAKPSPARRPAVAAVPTAATPGAQARALARWLRAHAR